MLEKQEVLKLAKKYGIFCAIVLCLFTVLLVVTLFSRESWRQGLAGTLQETLNASYPDTYAVGNPVPLLTPFSTSAAIYNLTLKKVPSSSQQLRQYGVLVRIPTIAGPAPAVFLYSHDSGVAFVGYALNYGKAARVFENDIGLKIIQYWQAQVLDILNTAGVNGDEK